MRTDIRQQHPSRSPASGKFSFHQAFPVSQKARNIPTPFLIAFRHPDICLETVVNNLHRRYVKRSNQRIPLSDNPDAIESAVFRKKTEHDIRQPLYPCSIISLNLFPGFILDRLLRTAEKTVVIRHSVLLHERKRQPVGIYTAHRQLPLKQRQDIQPKP